MREFGPNLDVALLGLSLFVLGFGLGPLVWGPLSEVCVRASLICVDTNAYIDSYTAGALYSLHPSSHTPCFTSALGSPRTLLPYSS